MALVYVQKVCSYTVFQLILLSMIIGYFFENVSERQFELEAA